MKSPKNVRKVPHTKADLQAFAASIAALGMLQYPVVEPELGPRGKPTGNYLVNAGEGRRLAQLLRVKRKEIKADEPIRCILDTEHSATERIAIEPDKLADFRKARLQDYNLLLIKEAMIGRIDGNVPPDKLAAITRREVAAQRMSPEDELHKFAVAGDAILPPRPAPSKTGIGARVASWFK
jgi:hypothetical protein